jgi:hypothetical protein
MDKAKRARKSGNAETAKPWPKVARAVPLSRPNRGGPVAVVVISSNGKGDRPVESLEVKVPGGRPEYRSDPYRGASNLAGRSECVN